MFIASELCGSLVPLLFITGFVINKDIHRDVTPWNESLKIFEKSNIFTFIQIRKNLLIMRGFIPVRLLIRIIIFDYD